ncbi:MAG: hypothetical protein JO297_04720 [Nitrososphaeraceae archaeon]|nr:hypothetical protein [Nitrososphaeraceae archaeon]
MLSKICEDLSLCPAAIHVNGNNAQPSSFALGNGGSQLVTMGPGSFQIVDTP